ncbi:hypothetical protein ACA910_012386 [Epithemia clementina (nom. ined.)]
MISGGIRKAFISILPSLSPRKSAFFPTRVLTNATAMSTITESSSSSLSRSSAIHRILQQAKVRVIPKDKLFEQNPIQFGSATPQTPKMIHDGPIATGSSHDSISPLQRYHNFANTNFGVLRVMNDDLVQPHRGFGTHPHANMEILTYIVEGRLTHQDSIATTGAQAEPLGRGSLQFMSAGTGVQHSEFNLGEKPLRFIQKWILPSPDDLEPNYGLYRGDNEDSKALRQNKIQHLVSNTKNAPIQNDDENTVDGATAPVQVNQDVDVYVSEMELGRSLVYQLPPDRQAYLLCVEGGVTVNGKQLQLHDSCEIHGHREEEEDSMKMPTTVEIQATSTEDTENGPVAHILLFSIKKVKGSGHTDFQTEIHDRSEKRHKQKTIKSRSGVM